MTSRALLRHKTRRDPSRKLHRGAEPALAGDAGWRISRSKEGPLQGSRGVPNLSPRL